MELKLFAVKCNQGFIREDLQQGPLCVSIQKASVFDESGLQRIAEMIDRARECGFTQVRKVELLITEYDPFKE